MGLAGDDDITAGVKDHPGRIIIAVRCAVKRSCGPLTGAVC